MVPIPILTLILLCLSQNALTYGFRSFTMLQLPSPGSESYAFDSDNVGPYTALNDGRIVKFQPNKKSFVEFATTSANRSNELCYGTDGNDIKTCMTCGRPLALEFNHNTKELYIIDAYFGLMVVGIDGGLATPLTAGTHFDFGDAIDIDPITGVVYITDLGDIQYRYNTTAPVGTVLKYDPRTKQVDVILRGLAMPAGVALSQDRSFLLISEYMTCNITRFWLNGPKANTTETFVELPGHPDNIKRTSSGDFWVAMNIKRRRPEAFFPFGQKISASGRILETVNFYGEYNLTAITEVQEHHGAYYVASLGTDFVGVYEQLTC